MDCPFEVMFLINPSMPSIDAFISSRNNILENILRCQQIAKQISLCHKLQLRDLQSGKYLIKVEEEQLHPFQECPLIDTFIEFLKNLIVIEKKLSIKFEVPDTISLRDEKVAEYISKILNGEAVECPISSFEASSPLSADFKGTILKWGEEDYEEICLVDSLSRKFKLLNAEIELPVNIELHHLQVDDVNRLKGLVKYLKLGQQITVEFITIPNKSIHLEMLDNSKQPKANVI